MANPSDKLLIGLNGFKGAGKDSVGQILVDNFDFKRLAFADKLKQGVAALFGIPIENVDDFKIDDMHAYVALHGGNADDLGSTVKRSMSWRTFLQRFGTEMGRDVFGENFWVDQVLPKNIGPYSITGVLENIVVTDVRFENETIRVKEMGGFVVRIERPGFEGDGHSSEVKPSDELIDYTIWNTGNLNDLYATTQLMLENL